MFMKWVMRAKEDLGEKKKIVWQEATWGMVWIIVAVHAQKGENNWTVS